MAIWMQLKLVDQPSMQAAQAQVGHSDSCRKGEVHCCAGKLPHRWDSLDAYIGSCASGRAYRFKNVCISKHCSVQCRDLTLWARRFLNDSLNGIIHNFAFHQEA